MMEELTFACPVCGADVPRKAKACPECGACEKSGWSEDVYLDGLNLPDPPDQRPASRPTGLTGFWWVISVIVLIALLLLTLRGLW